jgi:hypothetical protein
MSEVWLYRILRSSGVLLSQLPVQQRISPGVGFMTSVGQDGRV